MEKEYIDLFKTLNLSRALFEFACGNDSMNETTVYLIDKDNKSITNKDLEEFFEDSVYRNIEFYVNSDGHYIGEHGVVTITLNEEENKFNYIKESVEEYEETATINSYIILTEIEKDFLNKYINDMLVIELPIRKEDNIEINYKDIFIMTKDKSEILENIKTKINTQIDFELSNNDDFNFRDNPNFCDATINVPFLKDLELPIIISYSYYLEKLGND